MGMISKTAKAWTDSGLTYREAQIFIKKSPYILRLAYHVGLWFFNKRKYGKRMDTSFWRYMKYANKNYAPRH